MAFHINIGLYKLLSLLLLNSLKLIVCLYVSDWYLLEVQLKFPDEHLRPFYMGGSHSLTSVTRKGDPPVCTRRQLAQTSSSGSTKASSEADRGMTVLIPLLIFRKKNPFSF